MVLSLVAPALTAQAAQTSATVDSNGKVTGTTLTGTGVDSYGTTDAKGNGDIAIAYDDGNGNTGSAKMDSNANVKVVSGLLVLNAVPDFGFGSAAEGSTVGLQSNDFDTKEEDSTNSDAVKITESRTEAPGFTLGAQIGSFTTAGDTTGKDYTLNLQPTALTDDQGASASTVKTNNISISGADTKATTLLDMNKGSYSMGAINASFNPTDKNVFLKLGDTTTGANAKDAKVTSYNAKITWTLTAKPTATTTEP